MSQPYYSHAGIEIWLGDNRDILPTLEAGSVDLVLTDPPYGTASTAKIQKRGGNGLKTFDIDWDHELPLGWVEEAYRILRPGGSLLTFMDKAAVTVLWSSLEECGLNPLQTVYWLKSNPPPTPRQNFCSAIETAIFASKSGAGRVWSGGATTGNVFTHPIVGGWDRTDHPTQKPTELMQWLCELMSRHGALVLDPFMGSGTTLVAAKLLGRRAIGIEISEAYAEIAANRLRQEVLPINGNSLPELDQLALEATS